MSLFTFSGVRADGSQQRGTLDAPDRMTAERQLRDQGLVITALSEASEQDRAEVLFTNDQQRKATSVLRGWEVTPTSPPPVPTIAADASPAYQPLLETVRLYAGWLLAWYGLVFALGAYQATKGLPFEMPLVYGLAQSPLVLSFAFATFLFLLLSTIAKALRAGVGLGIALALVWAIGVYAFRVNL